MTYSLSNLLTHVHTFSLGGSNPSQSVPAPPPAAGMGLKLLVTVQMGPTPLTGASAPPLLNNLMLNDSDRLSLLTCIEERGWVVRLRFWGMQFELISTF